MMATVSWVEMNGLDTARCLDAANAVDLFRGRKWVTAFRLKAESLGYRVVKEFTRADDEQVVTVRAFEKMRPLARSDPWPHDATGDVCDGVLRPGPPTNREERRKLALADAMLLEVFGSLVAGESDMAKRKSKADTHRERDRDRHAHECEACGRVWVHDGCECAGSDAAHMCPDCGHGPNWDRVSNPEDESEARR